MAKRGAAVLEMPEPGYAPENGSRERGAAGLLGARVRRDSVEDFADEYDAVERPAPRATGAQRSGVKLRMVGRLPLPQTTAGVVATGVALLLLLGVVLWLLAVTRTFLLHDERFRIAGPSAVEIEGNRHLKRAQVLGLFADDLERNIFRVSLEQRQADLEALPWVRRATVMRLLPGRLRVSLEERTPVAFVRQGTHIGLVDANGVLLEMASGPQAEHYSFPVVTGIAASDPASTRAARMKIFERFMGELDAGGAKNTESLSQIDLSDPEDVRALVEEHGATVLAHFGEDQFLERYKKVKELLPQWHAQYPNLASADLRYEHEIPLAMAAVKAPAPPVAVPRPAAKAVPVAAHPPPHPVPALKAPGKLVAVAKPPAASHAVPATAHTFEPAPVVKPWQPVGTPPSGAASVSAAARAGFAAKTPSVPAPPSVAHPTAKTPAKAVTRPAAAVLHPVAVAPAAKHLGGKPAAGKPLVPTETNQPPQAVQR